MADVYRKTSQDSFGLVFHLTGLFPLYCQWKWKSVDIWSRNRYWDRRPTSKDEHWRTAGSFCSGLRRRRDTMGVWGTAQDSDTSLAGGPSTVSCLYDRILADRNWSWSSDWQSQLFPIISSIRPSSTIKIELRRRSMLFRFRHKTYMLGQLAGQISELLENGNPKFYS